MIVLDTNVVSELMRPAPDERVVGWVREHLDDDLRTTAITVAEIRYGIARLDDGRRKRLLATTADELFGRFETQVLAFDADAAQWYAEIVSARDRGGRPIDGFDAQIASICRGHDGSLATRNGSDFAGTGVVIVDPWAAGDD